MPGESYQSGITLAACQVNAQIGIADWLASGPYHEWKLEGYKRVLGKYIPNTTPYVLRQQFEKIDHGAG
jgi:hypothetical protein